MLDPDPAFGPSGPRFSSPKRMMAGRRLDTTTKMAFSPLPSFLLALGLAALPMASAHDHDSSHIEEGQTISIDPIVCFDNTTPRKPPKTTDGSLGN